MNNKILVILLLAFLASCGSSKKVRTSTNKPIAKTETNKKTTKNNDNQAVSKGNDAENVNFQKTEELEATSKVSATSITVYDYINQFKTVAQDEMREFKIPASITLAQGILESGAGKGRLCLEANNHFGIKCHSGWTGPSITHDDDAVQECFRKYADPADSYRDHSKFLTSRSWYKPLFKLDILDYKGWANGLKKAGYATDPKYPAKLIGIIERYQLYLFDHEVVAPMNDKESNIVLNEEDRIKEELNNEELYTIQKGDTLYSLSKKFNLTVEQLKEKNNLKDNSLSIGQVIKTK